MDKGISFEGYLGSIKDKKISNYVAIYQIEKTLQEEFKNNIYKNKIFNVRFNVTKVYTDKEKNNKFLK